MGSRAGCNVWPKTEAIDVPLRPEQTGFRMAAANGTEIPHYCKKLIEFRGVVEAGAALN